ncbi:MAG: hypothetical protein ABR523_10760 [Desulfurivibrionaceae bacterium]
MRLKPIILLLLVTEFSQAGISFANGAGAGAQSPFKSAIPVLGILTFLSLLTTVSLGLLFHRKRLKVFPWHRRMAFTTLTLAVIHGSLVLLFH